MKIRLELAVPLVVAIIMASGAMLGSHRAAIKDEYIAGCLQTQTAEACQVQWWKGPTRLGWSTDDLWACWVGNPEACVEERTRRERRAIADPAPAAATTPPQSTTP